MSETSDEIDTIIDSLLLAWPPSDAAIARYERRKLPFSLKDVVARLGARGLLARLVDHEFRMDDTLLLERPGRGYEVFVGERGGKHWLRSFDDLDAAVEYKVRLMLNGLGTGFSEP
jgi:hypothetical protein